MLLCSTPPSSCDRRGTSGLTARSGVLRVVGNNTERVPLSVRVECAVVGLRTGRRSRAVSSPFFFSRPKKCSQTGNGDSFWAKGLRFDTWNSLALPPPCRAVGVRAAPPGEPFSAALHGTPLTPRRSSRSLVPPVLPPRGFTAGFPRPVRVRTGEERAHACVCTYTFVNSP